MARVCLDNLSKVFHGPKGASVHAVRGLTLAIEDRELVVLVGPSGCGKSTTLRLVAGLEELSSGTISIGDRVVNGVEPKDRDLAMVFQNYALYPHMTVYENMAFGLRLRRYPKRDIDRRVRETAEVLGLTPLLNRLPKALSGGERQRVAVGRAMVRQPKAFLFDEPLSNLDAPMRAQMRRELKRLHERLAATMIYVTHDQVEALTLGDRIVVMNDGLVQQVADPWRLYRAPASLFVAGFIGSPPMNFAPGLIELDDGTWRFRFQDAARTPPRVEMRLPVVADHVPALRPYADRAVILGLRPEHVVPVPSQGVEPAGDTVGARVELVEPMGAETYVHLDAGGWACAGRWTSDWLPATGETLRLKLEMAHAHFFDPETTRAITVPKAHLA